MQKIGSLQDFPDGQATELSLAGDSVLVCRVGEDLYAVENTCTHDESPIGCSQLLGHELECPRHGARFDIRTGEVTVPPAMWEIATYHIELRDQEVYLGEKK